VGLTPGPDLLGNTVPRASPQPVPEEVLRWARRPGAAALLRTVRTKVEAGKVTDGVRVAVAEGHRDDVGRLLGVNWELSGRDVKLRLLREALARDGTDLESLLTAVGGPLRDLPAEKRAARTSDDSVRAGLLEVLVGAGVADQVADLAVRRRWLSRDLHAAVAVAEKVAAAWLALPRPPGSAPGSDGKVRGLAEFAGQVLLDPHALDRVSPAGRALARIAAASFAVIDTPEDPNAVAVVPLEEMAAAWRDITRASRWRTVWARLGITCDQVSSTVLVLNVPLFGTNPALAEVTATLGEPVWVTARMTSQGCAVVASGDLGPTAEVMVCENPSIAETAADVLGSRCPPLICLYGRPSGAAWAVLEAAAAAGARVLVSTDRDLAGAQIAAEVTSMLDAEFGAGTVVPWLPQAEGTFEEERLDALLVDLGRRADLSGPGRA
jgi:uncharacterized protein (TIGR02679 family)